MQECVISEKEEERGNEMNVIHIEASPETMRNLMRVSYLLLLRVGGILSKAPRSA